MGLPPRPHAPDTDVLAVGAAPDPRALARGKIPPGAAGSAPRPGPEFAAAAPVPFMPLPGSSPRPMLVPPPAPPSPVLSPPDGDMKSDPVPPTVGKPTFDPGSLEMTAPTLLPLPALLAGARTEPESSRPPSPAPLRPTPEPLGLEPPPRDGGAGTTLLASDAPLADPARSPLDPVPDSDGGGATTLGLSDAPAPERFPTLPDP